VRLNIIISLDTSIETSPILEALFCTYKKLQQLDGGLHVILVQAQ